LEAGIEYEIIPDIAMLGAWVLINPDKSFLMNLDINNYKGIKSFTATQTGEHWLAFYDEFVLLN
jgi:hypothetical protein